MADNLVSVEDEFSFDAQGTCIGPFVPLQPIGEPIACTIGFWKNRADGKQGTLQWFPNGDFTATVNAAVALSSGIFSDAADLLYYLQSKGNRSILVRAKQQLAATLLNLAAGDSLFPDNQKCKAVRGQQHHHEHLRSWDHGWCRGELRARSTSSATTPKQHEAQACFDDINNGIGVVQQPTRNGAWRITLRLEGGRQSRFILPMRQAIAEPDEIQHRSHFVAAGLLAASASPPGGWPRAASRRSGTVARRRRARGPAHAQRAHAAQRTAGHSESTDPLSLAPVAGSPRRRETSRAPGGDLLLYASGR